MLGFLASLSPATFGILFLVLLGVIALLLVALLVLVLRLRASKWAPAGSSSSAGASRRSFSKKASDTQPPAAILPVFLDPADREDPFRCVPGYPGVPRQPSKLARATRAAHRRPPAPMFGGAASDWAYRLSVDTVAAAGCHGSPLASVAADPPLELAVRLPASPAPARVRFSHTSSASCYSHASEWAAMPRSTLLPLSTDGEVAVVDDDDSNNSNNSNNDNQSAGAFVSSTDSYGSCSDSATATVALAAAKDGASSSRNEGSAGYAQALVSAPDALAEGGVGAGIQSAATSSAAAKRDAAIAWTLDLLLGLGPSRPASDASASSFDYAALKAIYADTLGAGPVPVVATTAANTSTVDHGGSSSSSRGSSGAATVPAVADTGALAAGGAGAASASSWLDAVVVIAATTANATTTTTNSPLGEASDRGEQRSSSAGILTFSAEQLELEEERRRAFYARKEEPRKENAAPPPQVVGLKQLKLQAREAEPSSSRPATRVLVARDMNLL